MNAPMTRAEAVATGVAGTALPNIDQAVTFLTALDEDAATFCFQTFDDQKARKDASLTRVLNGTLEQHFAELADLNRRGAGIFVTVNVTDGKGRKLENMLRPRALFQEADRPNTPVPPLDPHIEVESSPGKFHRYWLIDETTAPTFNVWGEGMERMVMDFGSDPNARDPSRVLRLPGFYHRKDPSQPFMVRIHSALRVRSYSWLQITEVIKPLARQKIDTASIRRKVGRGIPNPIQLRSALTAINPDGDYLSCWLKVGMALHHATSDSGEGYVLWDEWSAAGDSYRDGETEYKWTSFGRYSGDPATLNTVFFLAREAGWDWTVEQSGLIDEARAVVEQVLADSISDPKAFLAPSAIEAFRMVKAYDATEFEALRMDLKQANHQVRIAALDQFVAGARDSDADADDSLPTRLADLAAERCQLWHDKDGAAFASMMREGADGTSHREHWRIDSTGYREWLSWLAHTELGAAPSSESVKSAQNALAGKAKFDGDEHAPARRVAKDESGYWIDLCDEGWRAILVTATGWRIMPEPTVRFIRTKAMRPLPVPVESGNLDTLWRLCNFPEEDEPLVLAWILECYRSETPYPVLELIGEQGSAKSTTQETLRWFIDPNKVMLRGRPKGVEDVYVAAGSNHLISLENLSGISPELSDALCTIATGGGQAGRQLYSNDEENIIEAHNPVVLNGIGAVIVRADLLDRAIALCLPVINERMTEEEHTASLIGSAPGIFGALLNLFALTLARLPSIAIPPAQRPRMADFAQLGEAMRVAMGSKEGEFLTLYTNHRRDAIRRTVDSNPVAVACMELTAKGHSYTGTVKGLLEKLNAFSMNMERGDYWPRAPRGLGDALRRVAPALRQIGIQVSVDAKPKRDGVHCEVRLADVPTTPCSSPTSNKSERHSQSSQTFTKVSDAETGEDMA